METGRILWSAAAKDPRLFTLSTDVKTSVMHAVKNALSMLKKDLTVLSIKARKEKNVSSKKP
jgi:hypothetical protein